MDGLNENTHLQQSLELLSPETEGWKQRMQDLKGRKDLLECSNARMQRMLDDKISQLNSLIKTTLKTIHLPDLLKEGHVETGNLEVEEKREAENDHHPMDLSEADLKSLI